MQRTLKCLNHRLRTVSESAERPTLKIVSAYEDFAANLRARELLDRLALGLKGEFKISHDSWKFELLGHPQLREYAAADAAGAALIIVSADGEVDLPAFVKDWVSSCIQPKRSVPAALVALLSREEDVHSTPPPACTDLRQLAEHAQLDFFCMAGDWRRQDFEYIMDAGRHRRDGHGAILERALFHTLRAQFASIGKSGLNAFRESRRAWWPEPWSLCIPKTFPWWLKAERGVRNGRVAMTRENWRH